MRLNNVGQMFGAPEGGRLFHGRAEQCPLLVAAIATEALLE